MMSAQETYQVTPIGRIRRLEDGVRLEILEPYRAALLRLDHFSHVMVCWWADKHDTEQSRSIMQTEPPYAEGKVTGVFATRAEYRPDPVAMTTCKVLTVDEQKGVVEVAKVDAFDGTPIIDLKAYFPVCDRVNDARIPAWLSDRPDWMPV
jgi:tRNA-Thr(GGU) m(6)t(6)A37 methyltransferase TsaA